MSRVSCLESRVSRPVNSDPERANQMQGFAAAMFVLAISIVKFNRRGLDAHHAADRIIIAVDTARDVLAYLTLCGPGSLLLVEPHRHGAPLTLAHPLCARKVEESRQCS